MAKPDWYRSRSFWFDDLDGDPLVPRAPLPGDLEADVAIVGAGFTGLWTAYELARRDPHLRVVVLEREIAGFGASGRNGGWCSAFLPMSLTTMAARHGRDAAIALQRAMFDTVDEVVAVCAREGIDAQVAKGGTLQLATAPVQVPRVRASVTEYEAFGFGDGDVRWLDRREARAMVGADGVLGGAFSPRCAAIQPARLARGLARVVEDLGVRVYEQTAVSAIEPGRARTDHGVVRAEHVVRATEAFTVGLAGARRDVAPVYSLMVATEPLPSAVWDEIGLAERPTFTDGRNLIIYGQRTAGGRLAFGGRGAPYHFGSRLDPAFDRDERVFTELRQVLRTLFPALHDHEFSHAWGGPLAIPRDWHASVGLDRSTGLAWAGGYVGDGVATTNLAGRTLADLLTGADTDLTRLAWVDHRSPRWEPEPLRWLGINGGLWLARGADAAESRTGRPSRGRAAAMERLLGH